MGIEVAPHRVVVRNIKFDTCAILRAVPDT